MTRDIARSAIVDSQNESVRLGLNADLNGDRMLFYFRRRVWMQFDLEFDQTFVVRDSPELFIAVRGPVGAFLIACSEAIRKRKPSCDPVSWTPDALVIVIPKTIKSPDIVRIRLQSRGKTIVPTFNGLLRQEISSETLAKRMIHRGEVRYPITAFAPGDTVILTLIPEAGKSIVKWFTAAELLRIQ